MRTFELQAIRLLVLVYCMSGHLWAQNSSIGVAGPETLRVMSFNIRFGTARDGENHWDKRKENVLTTIREYDPDLLGTQETLKFQADYLAENFANFLYIGRSREANDVGEQCGVLFRKDRFEVLDRGYWWLSETPEKVGSKSWDAALPRIATWVKLSDKKTKTKFLFVNTHFDHVGVSAREKSAELLMRLVQENFSNLPVVLTGDFNMGPESKGYAKITETLNDTYKEKHADKSESGTFGGFRGKRNGKRIDFIFASANTKIMDATIVHRQFNGRDPSDHFPVTATILLP